MKALDTNVLIRYLVQDDTKQALAASRFIESCCTEDQPCFIGHITLCETAWVLESNYAQSKTEIGEVLEKLLQVGQLEVMEPSVVWKALRDYQSSNADFSDHLLARVNESAGCEVTVTFDKKASKNPVFELLK